MSLDELTQVLLKIKKVNPDSKLPSKNYNMDAGLDLYYDATANALPFYDGHVPLDTNEITRLQTGICIEIPIGYCGIIKDRSSLASKGIHVLGGVIHFGYTGEIIVVLTNVSKHIHTIYHGDKIAQLVILPVPELSLQLIAK